MDQYLNNRQNEILWNLLANPADNGHLYTYNLQRMVSDFPQSGLLHALLTRSGNDQGINHAAAYIDPRALYSIVNDAERLAVVADGRIIQQLSSTVEYATREENEPSLLDEEGGLNNFAEIDEPGRDSDLGTATDETDHAELVAEAVNEVHDLDTIVDIAETEEDIVETEPVIEELQDDEPIVDAEAVEVIEPTADESESVEGLSEENNEPVIVAENISHDELITETPSFELEPVIAEEEIESLADQPEAAEIPTEEINEVEPPAEHTVDAELVSEGASSERKDIDDDVYDEIVGIEDISFARTAKSTDEIAQPELQPVVDEELLPIEADYESATETTVHRDRALNMDDEAEKLIVGNIAATDYFAFDRAVNDRKQVDVTVSNEVVAEPVAVNESAIAATATAENQEVSKYHDEKMPYTFMWWLDKTRKEHASTYQPFKLDTSQAIRQSGAQELQQQYYENIFHLNSVEELDRSTSHPTVEFDMKSKEDRIIKRFIVEEPHITPPSSDKLDTENKARKSAEDQDELVTETLARIYTDQMLYHKAIHTYKKLMLKFPEKSRYFADQIEQLERKTN
ncbi:MAG: hypothetical protein ACXVAU_02880 [Mucilaginibacter sp.]